jgi:hypothetical protein
MTSETRSAARSAQPARVLLIAVLIIDAIACSAALAVTAPLLLVALPIAAAIPKVGAMYMFTRHENRWVAALLAGAGVLLTLGCAALFIYFFAIASRFVR